ncbi:MAG: hypothetical protein MUP17_11570 [candidate division Zixibacteria bacterium]|nr:hypothetical protein [candidate division Zixibacteria bacterium]
MPKITCQLTKVWRVIHLLKLRMEGEFTLLKKGGKARFLVTVYLAGGLMDEISYSFYTNL